MRQFSLEEYLKNPSKKVVTRSGRAVKIHCTNYVGDQPIIAQIEDCKYSASFTENGKYWKNKDVESNYDLFFAPEKKIGWINLYKNSNGYVYPSQIWKTKEDAEKSENYIATIKIEWEE